MYVLIKLYNIQEFFNADMCTGGGKFEKIARKVPSIP